MSEVDKLSEDLLRELPKDVQIQYVQSISFSGPIPPPGLMSAYENVHPGLADRIMTMAEKEQDHRLDMDQKDERLKSLSIRVILWTIIMTCLLAFMVVYFDEDIRLAYAFLLPLLGQFLSQLRSLFRQ